jgi:type I restriction enzyme M protein
MIDAYNFKGKMLSKKLRELTLEENNKILNIYNKHNEGQKIEEIGFAKSINLKEIEENDYSFVPGRYVGFVEEEIDTEKIKKEIKETSIELKKLLNEFQDLIPKVEESIEKALNFEEKKEKE